MCVEILLEELNLRVYVAEHEVFGKNVGVGCGSEVQVDVIKAINLALNAAEKGYPPAENLIGVFYFNGIGLEKNLDKAIEYFKKAATQCLPDGQFNLARFFENGYGNVEVDLNKAIFLYIKAIKQGHIPARYHLGNIFYKHHIQFKNYILYKDNINLVKNYYDTFLEKYGLKNNSIFNDYVNNHAAGNIFKEHITNLSINFIALERKWGLPKEFKKEFEKNNNNHKLKPNII